MVVCYKFRADIRLLISILFLHLAASLSDGDCLKLGLMVLLHAGNFSVLRNNTLLYGHNLLAFDP